MNKYAVIKDFRDRISNRVFRVGSLYFTDNEERRNELATGGYIDSDAVPQSGTPTFKADEALPAGVEHIGGGYYTLPNGEKVRGKEEAIAAAEALRGADDEDAAKGEASAKDK